MPPALKAYLPTKFKSLAQLDRCRKLCLALPVPIMNSKRIPFGYILNPNNKDEAIPNEKAFRCLLKAKQYLKDASYFDVANWLTSCGYPISDEGLHKLIQNRPPFDEVALPYEERMKL